MPHLLQQQPLPRIHRLRLTRRNLKEQRIKLPRPLDGGKILIEVIQLVIRRPLSLRVQTIMSYIGIAFFVFIFVFALRNDIVNIVMG